MNTPYTTTATGVQIGLRHTPEPAMPAIQGDASHLQTALLEPRTAKAPGALAWFFGKIWRWL